MEEMIEDRVIIVQVSTQTSYSGVPKNTLFFPRKATENNN